MGAYFENTVIIIGIILNIAGGVLSAAYIFKSCFDKNILLEEAKKSYIGQIKLCYIWGIILIAFGWLISPEGSNITVCIGLQIDIIMWAIIFLASIIFMLPFTKKLNENIIDEYMINLKDIGVISIAFLFVSIVLYWFVS